MADTEYEPNPYRGSAPARNQDVIERLAFAALREQLAALQEEPLELL